MAANKSINLSIVRKYRPDQDIVNLVGELDKALAGYAPEQHHGLRLEQLFAPNITFYIAYVDDVAAGCAGLAFFHDYAELKRMYVKEKFRGTPLARSIMAHIEYVALAQDYNHIMLETGNKQIAAMRFYAREGFADCLPFGDYLTLDKFAIETSVFMEKKL